MQFNQATNRIIQLIDVLWLRGNAIVAAFEVEHTTSVYSGLLRMSDLLHLQPNIQIKLYLVAPDTRRDKVREEANRPTFSCMQPSLVERCWYIPYSQLQTQIARVGSLAKYLRPDFLDTISETLFEA